MRLFSSSLCLGCLEGEAKRHAMAKVSLQVISILSLDFHIVIPKNR